MDIKRTKKWRLITKTIAEADERADRLVRRWSALVEGGDVVAETEEDLRRQARLVVDHYRRAMNSLNGLLIDIKAYHHDVLDSADQEIHDLRWGVRKAKERIESKVEELLLQRRG